MWAWSAFITILLSHACKSCYLVDRDNAELDTLPSIIYSCYHPQTNGLREREISLATERRGTADTVSVDRLKRDKLQFFRPWLSLTLANLLHMCSHHLAPPSTTATTPPPPTQPPPNSHTTPTVSTRAGRRVCFPKHLQDYLR